jgi:hypothetical protein
VVVEAGRVGHWRRSEDLALPGQTTHFIGGQGFPQGTSQGTSQGTQGVTHTGLQSNSQTYCIS